MGHFNYAVTKRFFTRLFTITFDVSPTTTFNVNPTINIYSGGPDCPLVVMPWMRYSHEIASKPYQFRRLCNFFSTFIRNKSICTTLSITTNQALKFSWTSDSLSVLFASWSC